MPRASEICRMDAVTLAARVRAKELSAIEVADAVIAHMEEVEPHLHAFCTPAPDYARAAARQVDARIAAGEDPGPLAGVPVGIKDLVCTKDLPTVSGSIAYEGFMPDEDDVAVERLRAAGAVILGKTNVPEFGYSGASHNAVFEATRNPWNLERSPRRLQRGLRRRGGGWRRAARGRQRRRAARCGFRRPSAGSWGSRRRWDGCRSTPVAATSATPASPAGRGSSISAR